MSYNAFNFRSARQDFQSAHLRSTIEEVLARIRGKSNRLLSFEEVAKKLKLQVRSEGGIRTIPVHAIVGSVGRYEDFTRTFLPRNLGDEERWAHVKSAMLEPMSIGLPPIEVYKVSNVYFVLDGNHRVSIARREGWKLIEAHVIEVKTLIPLTPDANPDDLIIKAEYSEFLQETGIMDLRENVDLNVTIPGRYQKLTEEIRIRQFELIQEQGNKITFQDAVLDWYDNTYIPFAESVRDRGLMRWFPERTITDLYAWMTEHRDALEEELGWSLRPDVAAELIVQQNTRAANEAATTGSWRKTRITDRYTENLFREILVPLSGTPESWQAMEQAVHIAQREEANLHGLYIVDAKEKLSNPETIAVQTRFNESCESAGVKGNLVTEVGEPTKKILERSVLSDLIVLKIAYPPSDGIASLTSNIHTIIARSARPILAVPSEATPTKQTLLVFDGSPKSKEALFVATYFAEQWNTKLTIFSTLKESNLASPGQGYVRAYLELHEVQADYLIKNDSLKTMLPTIEETGADLVVMGGYSGIVKEMISGSLVNLTLRKSRVPVLICR